MSDKHHKMSSLFIWLRPGMDVAVSNFNDFLYFLTQAGWKLWPFAHLITYGVIPVEQRLLWVDTIELIWVTILSTYVYLDLF